MWSQRVAGAAVCGHWAPGIQGQQEPVLRREGQQALLSYLFYVLGRVCPECSAGILGRHGSSSRKNAGIDQSCQLWVPRGVPVACLLGVGQPCSGDPGELVQWPPRELFPAHSPRAYNEGGQFFTVCGQGWSSHSWVVPQAAST